MLVAAAFVPAAPLLVPQVASGAADELDELRDAAITAVGAVLDAEVDEVLLLGLAPRTGAYPADAVASFHGFGLPSPAGGNDGGSDAVVLPAALSVGRWLIDEALAARGRADHELPGPLVQPFGVTVDDPSVRCADLGRVLAERSDRVAAVVVGDGSARRGPKAPGALDERSQAFDQQWLDAVAIADLDVLAGLDASLAYDLMAGGRAPWQVAAAMAGAADAVEAAPSTWSATLVASEDRYGVMYAVATWQRVTPDPQPGGPTDGPTDEQLDG